MRTCFLGLILLLTLGSCRTNECVGHAPATVEAFVAAGLDVHCEDAASFAFEGRTVRVTHVAYGAQQDCPSGCFSSAVCAIEDPAMGAPQLLVANWYAVGEAPIGIETECPTLSATSQVGSTYPDCRPSGLLHPVVATDAFRRWAMHESGSGPLRWCLYAYHDTTYWP